MDLSQTDLAAVAAQLGVTAEELARHLKRDELKAEANAAALPGALREAFAGEPRELYGFKLLPVTAGVEAILARIDSPLLATFAVLLANHGKPVVEIKKAIEKKVKAAPEAIPETVFCFLRPPRELRMILDKGRTVFREAAMEAVGDKVNTIQLGQLYRAVSEHYAAAFATAISHEAERSGDEGFPKPPAGPATGSAGGSTLSAP